MAGPAEDVEVAGPVVPARIGDQHRAALGVVAGLGAVPLRIGGGDAPAHRVVLQAGRPTAGGDGGHDPADRIPLVGHQGAQRVEEAGDVAGLVPGGLPCRAGGTATAEHPAGGAVVEQLLPVGRAQGQHPAGPVEVDRGRDAVGCLEAERATGRVVVERDRGHRARR